MKSTKHLKLLVGAIILTSWINVFGQTENLTFSLDEARAYAVEHSYYTRKAVLDQEIAIKKMKETTAIGLPQLNGSAEFQNFIDIPTSLVPDFTNPGSDTKSPVQFGTNYNINAGIQATQIIFNGSYLVGLEAAKVYRDMSEKVVVKSEREIKDQVTKAYGNVIVAVENYETLKENKEYLEQTLIETQAIYESGFSKEQDVDQLTLLVQSAEIEFNRADRLRLISENFLKYQMGIETTESITLTDSLEFIVDYGNDSSVVNQVFDVNKNIDYQIALTNQDLQYLNYKNTKAQFLPSLNAFYSYQQGYQGDNLSGGSDNWFPTSLWGLQMNIPIFSSFERRYIKQQADLNFQKSQIDSKMSEEGLTVEFLTKKSEYQFAIDQYKNSKNNLELVQRIVNKETVKYQEGVSSSLNLANAQIQFFQIQAGYVQSIMQMIDARSAMDRILNNY